MARTSVTEAFKQLEPFVESKSGNVLFSALVYAIPAEASPAMFDALVTSKEMHVSDRTAQMVSVIEKWSKIDLQQAWAAATEQMPSSRSQQRLLQTLINNEVDTDPERLKQWLDALPDSMAKSYGLQKLNAPAVSTKPKP